MAAARAKTRFAYCDGPLPFPPGVSPFRWKGEFYRQAAVWLEHHDRKSGGRVAAILEQQGLREFVSQTFLSSAFYDLLPMPRLVMAVAEARDRDVHQMTEQMGRAAAEGQMKGVYGGFLNALRSDNFHRRFEQVLKHFYDFGTVTVTAAPGGAQLVRAGVPLCIAEWWSVVSVPFAVVPLETNGARDVRVDWRIEPRGEHSGVPCGDVLWDVRWSEGP